MSIDCVDWSAMMGEATRPCPPTGDHRSRRGIVTSAPNAAAEANNNIGSTLCAGSVAATNMAIRAVTSNTIAAPTRHV